MTYAFTNDLGKVRGAPAQRRDFPHFPVSTDQLADLSREDDPIIQAPKQAGRLHPKTVSRASGF